MYTIRDYTRAIRQHYTHRRYHKFLTLYGYSRRDILIKYPTSFKLEYRMNTHNFKFNRTHIDIEVDSAESTRVQVIIQPLYFVRIIGTWFAINILKRDVHTYFLERQAKLNIVYTNPTPQFIASLLPRDYLLDIKLLFTRLLYCISNYQCLFLRLTESFSSTRVRANSISTVYYNFIRWNTWDRLCSRYILEYIPFLYITSLARVGKLIRWYYASNWLLVCLRGGWYGSGVDVLEEVYTLDTGYQRYKFKQYVDRDFFSSIVTWYLVPKNSNEYNIAQKLTYWGLFKLLRNAK
jgi:hypothetical protein